MGLGWGSGIPDAAQGPCDAPLSSAKWDGSFASLILVSPHAADDAVGGVSLVGAACFASGPPLSDLAVEVVADVGGVALLGD